MPQHEGKALAIVVMGVSGSGKSSVGDKIASILGLPFVEGDRLHPASNVEKISKGIPLNDDDRMPWLDLIGEAIRVSLAQGGGAVVSCSALKRVYRERLRRAAGGRLFFIYLRGDQALLAKRIGERKGHFAPASLLVSQLATLESPEGEPDIVTVDIDDTIDAIAGKAVRGLSAISL